MEFPEIPVWMLLQMATKNSLKWSNEYQMIPNLQSFAIVLGSSWLWYAFLSEIIWLRGHGHCRKLNMIMDVCHSLARTLSFLLIILRVSGIIGTNTPTHDLFTTRRSRKSSQHTIANRSVVELQPVVEVRVWGHWKPRSDFFVGQPAGLWSRWVNHNNADLVSDKPWCWIQWQPWSRAWSQCGNLGVHGHKRKFGFDVSGDHVC